MPLRFGKSRNSDLDSEAITDIYMWVAGTAVGLQKIPLEGEPEMFRLIPTSALEPGVYAVHWGAIRKMIIPGVDYCFDPEMLRAYFFSVNIDQIVGPLTPKIKDVRDD